jgi:cytochrome c biogenesis protein ResB
MEDEENMAGLTFAVKGEEIEDVYVVLENVPKLPEIEIAGETYRFELRKQRRTLPFQIELLEFRREMHPGTDLAKAYSSRVRITDGAAQWESLIRMNEPLRYKGYTLFQSSFIETPDGDISVLAVVWNAGRSFPYISGLVMCLGIIVHLFVRRKKMVKTEKDGTVKHA